MENSSLPPQIKDWIGKTVVKDSSPLIVQSVLWQNFCSAIEDGNSLYWDAEVAKNHTNQIVAHPALLPSWLHDFEWHPNRDKKMPMQLHFLIKEALELPLGIVTEVDIEFYEPIYDGDHISAEQKLLSVSEEVDTSLGKGRYWSIEVIFKNQTENIVGKQNMHFLGYQK